MTMFDYISILAGGRCAFDCPFCIGASKRKNEPPHFGDGYIKFIKNMGTFTDELSLSGSNSDPIFIPDKDLKQIFAEAANNDLRTSFHTLSKSNKTKRITALVNEMCMSTHGVTEKDVKFVNTLAEDYKEKLRISSVCTRSNKELFEDESFYEAFNVDRFTIRLDVFDGELEPPTLPFQPIEKDDYGATWYEYEGKSIALWDFEKTNQEINALYLWPDGSIEEQCHWNNMHKHAPEGYNPENMEVT